MFGNFAENFALNFPIDVQGGLFPTAPPAPPQASAGSSAAAAGGPATPPGGAAPAPSLAPAEGVGGASPAPTAPGSALGSPLAPQQMPTAPQSEPPPAAGVGSQFGKV